VQSVRGHDVKLEYPAEIIAKKVYFRGSHFQPRDMFDLAAVMEHYGDDYVIAALRQCGKDRCETALGVIDKANPAFVENIISQLMYRGNTAHLVKEAREISRRILSLAV
jgi:hypothetical protein